MHQYGMGGGLKTDLLQRAEEHTELEDALSAKRTIKISVTDGTTVLTAGQEWMVMNSDKD